MGQRYYKGEPVCHVVGRYIADSRNIEYATKDKAWTTDVRQAQVYTREGNAINRAAEESSADIVYTVTVLPVHTVPQVRRLPVLYCVWRER